MRAILDGMKVCCRCKENKPYSEYHRNRSTSDTLHPSCKVCANSASKKRREAIRIKKEDYERWLKKFEDNEKKKDEWKNVSVICHESDCKAEHVYLEGDVIKYQHLTKGKTITVKCKTCDVILPLFRMSGGSGEINISCYDNDCEAQHTYTKDETYEYYDAELGQITAVTCKTCGLTIPLRWR